jgi:hypothetical protein
MFAETIGLTKLERSVLSKEISEKTADDKYDSVKRTEYQRAGKSLRIDKSQKNCTNELFTDLIRVIKRDNASLFRERTTLQ